MASRAGWKFQDLDTLIEKAEGKPVMQIFRESGEEYFREIETAALRNIRGDENVVIACGGGTPCHGDNMEFMNREGITVYIKHKPETLFYRLSRAKKMRPLLREMNGEEMRDYIKHKIEEREKWYNKARLIIDGLKADPGKIMDIILLQPPYNR